MNLLNVLQKFAKLFHAEWWEKNPEKLKEYNCYSHPLFKYDIYFEPWINHNEITITIRLNNNPITKEN